ncbi:MAG: ATP-binding protein [Candidatus Bathyarchaeota archaeon]|nr:ATP-binding protein [Candidatus Bathyarchaeota archaeon]
MKITISDKLLLGFGFLILLLALSAYISYQQTTYINQDVHQIVYVALPLEEAVLEMEIGVWETAIEVLKYVRDPDADTKESVSVSAANFERTAAEYRWMAETDEQEELGKEVATLYLEFKQSGDQIMNLTDQQTTELQIFRESVENIEELIDEKLKISIDRRVLRAEMKLESALGMENNIEEYVAAIESYLDSQDPTLLEEILDAEVEFEQFHNQYRETNPSTEETRLIIQIDENFRKAKKAGNEVIILTDNLNELLDQFEEDLEEIDNMIEDEIHPLIHAQTVKSAENAKSSGTVVTTSLIIMSVLGLSFGVGAALVIIQGISKPLFSLIEGAKKIGGGSYEYRIDLKTKDEIGTLTNAFNSMADQLQSRELMKDRFISSATHELRTPLVSIKGFIDRVTKGKSGRLPDQVTLELEIVKRNTERLLSLVNELLEVRRMESGKLKLNLKPIDLQEVIQHCAKEIQPLIEQKKQRFNLKVPRGRLPIKGDSVRLSQALMNLLDNASKFTPESGKIAFTVKNMKKSIQVQVKDTGIGIRKKDLGKIFEPFADIEKSSYVRGTGLGLSVTKGLIKGHKGRIGVESSGEGKGTTFTFTIPRIYGEK